MDTEYLMYTATFLYLSCYIPELYANYKNKNANMYNIPEKVIMLAATSFGLSYAITTQNLPLILNYSPFLLLDIIALSMRLVYVNENIQSTKMDIVMTTDDNDNNDQILVIN